VVIAVKWRSLRGRSLLWSTSTTCASARNVVVAVPLGYSVLSHDIHGRGKLSAFSELFDFAAILPSRPFGGVWRR
jgi:hypothetical protein